MPAPFMTPADKPTSPINFVHLAAAALALTLAVIILRELAVLLQPLLVAIFFFYIGAPLQRALDRKRMPPIIATLALALAAVAMLSLLGWVVSAHVEDFAAQIPAYRIRVQETMQDGIVWISGRFPRVGEEVMAHLSPQALPFDRLESVAKTIVGSFVGFLSASVLVVGFLVFITQEAISLPRRLEAAYGPHRARRILEVGRRINDGIIQYVYVKGLASLLIAALSIIVMLLFGLDFAVLWGTLVFFGNFIPYIGSAVAVILPILTALLQFSSFSSVLILAALLIACQVLVSNYVEPRFAGRRLNLSPLVVLLSLAFWGWLWGIVGLILSIPFMVSLKFVLENIPATRPLAVLLSFTSDGAAASPEPPAHSPQTGKG